MRLERDRRNLGPRGVLHGRWRALREHHDARPLVEAEGPPDLEVEDAPWREPGGVVSVDKGSNRLCRLRRAVG